MYRQQYPISRTLLLTSSARHDHTASMSVQWRERPFARHPESDADHFEMPNINALVLIVLKQSVSLAGSATAEGGDNE